MPFNTALSGIRAANTDLQVTGNNIANASTVGFKSSRTEFGDVYASTILGGGGSAAGGGVQVQDVAQQFSQGNRSDTENELDLAIGGSGFFVVSQGGDQLYTRAGAFGLDDDGYIVSKTDARLQGFAADNRGNIGGTLSDMRIETGNQPPRLTTAAVSSVNLDAAEDVLQRSGSTFATEGNSIGVAQVGQLIDTSSTLLSSSFGLPLANDFSDKSITFDVSLAGASNNNGVVSVTLDGVNGMPAAISTFNDLRTVAGVINGQLFSPNSASQSPVDVLAVAVNDGGGSFHLEFQSVRAGERSQVSVSNGNVSSVAASDQAGTVFDVSAGPTTAFSAIDPPTVARVDGAALIPGIGAGLAFAAGDTVTMTVNGVQSTIDLNDATVVAAADADGVAAAINGLLDALPPAGFGDGVTPGSATVQAVSNPGGAGLAGTISFESKNTGVTQTVSIAPPGGANPLGLTPLTDTGTDGASFDIAVNGSPSIRVPIGLIGAQTTLAGLESALDTALDTALAANGLGDLVNARVDVTSGRVFFESTSLGATNTLQITQVGNTDILGLASASPTLVNTIYRGGDAASALGLPVAGGSISDSSGSAGTTNNYPNQSIDVVDPDGNAVTFTSLAGSSAAETASDMNALAGVSATATTTATVSAYNNANGDAVITLNNVALVSDDLPSIATEINALTTSTLPGVSAVYDAVGQTLVVTSSVGDDLVFELSSADDGDLLTVLGSNAGATPVTLEADPLNDGTSTATTTLTPAGSTAINGSENYWTQVPAPSFDLSIDGQGFQAVDLQGINSDLLLLGSTPAAGVSAQGAVLTTMNTTFDLTLTGAAVGVANVDLTAFVTGAAATPAALQAEVQAAVDAALVGVPLAAGDVTVNLNPINGELSFTVGNPAATSADTLLLSNVGGTDTLDFGSVSTTMAGAPDAGAAPSITATEAAIQAAVDAAVGAGVIDVNLDPTTAGVIFETLLPGSNHSLRIANVANDVLGLGTVPNLVGTLFEGSDVDNVRAEGVGGNNSAIKVGGSIDIVLDEGYSVSDPDPSAAGMFAPFQAGTFEPFTINEFDPLDGDSFNHSTPLPIYDSLGTEHNMTQYFVKQAYDPSDPTTRPNSWEMHVLIDGQDVGDPDTTLAPPANTVATRATFNLTFDNNGVLDAALSDPVLISNWVPLIAEGSSTPLGPSNVLQGGGLPIPQPPTSSNFEIDMSGTTQHTDDFSVDNVDQDGFSSGRLSGIEIDNSGIIFARFTNGEAQALGQIALAEFPNVQGLQPVGNTMWAENFETGTPIVGAPGTSSLGSVQSKALEESNVNLSEELVKLIIAQRNFQANSKTIETANQITQTIINLR